MKSTFKGDTVQIKLIFHSLFSELLLGNTPVWAAALPLSFLSMRAVCRDAFSTADIFTERLVAEQN